MSHPPTSLSDFTPCRHALRARSRWTAWASLWLTAWLAASPALAAHEDFLVRSWQSEDGLPGNTVRGIVQAVDGYLWIATAEGVVRFDGVRFWSPPGPLSQKPVRSIWALRTGVVWVATSGGGLWCWTGSEVRQAWADTEDDREPRAIKDLAGDTSGTVLVDTSDGVFRIREDKVFEEPTFTTRALAEIETGPGQRSTPADANDLLTLTDGRGLLWARTANGALSVSKPGQPAKVLPEFADGKLVTALREDREGSLWVATNGAGLFQIRPRRVQVLDTSQGFPDLKMRALLEDRAGSLWTANRSGGIDRLPPSGPVESFEIGDRDKSRLITSLCEDSSGTLWAVKENGGLYRYSGGTFERVVTSQPNVQRASVLLSDPAGGIWLGGQDGIARWHEGSMRKFGLPEGVPTEPVTSMALDAARRICVGTARGTVYRGRENFAVVGDTGGAAVSALLPDPSGAIWAATLGEGLFLLHEGRKTGFTPPDERLTCLLEDSAEHLWLGSLGGIFRVSRKELQEMAAGHATQVRWVHLDRADGMASRECTGGFQPAGWRKRDGTLLFPTAHGIALLRPQEFALNTRPPEVWIEQAFDNRHSADIRENAVTVGPGRLRLGFQFTALSLVAPEKVRFRTRLEGMQSDWEESSTPRSVAYEAVPPGRYTFHVMATNNDGVWSAVPATLAVHILPHVWETAWFRGLVVIAVLGTAFGIGVMITRARARLKLLHLRVQTAQLIERERIAQDLHDDLGASLTEISLIAGLAAEEANTAKIPVIADKARQLVSTLDEIVWAVNPRHDTLSSFVEYLTASAAELLEAAGIALRLDIAPGLPELPLDSAQRHALLLAAREALNNAVKHSHATEVRLSLKLQDTDLHITVQDNGHGLPSLPSSQSEGLRNMRARMEAIGGTCSLTSDTTGTTVELSLALSKSSFPFTIDPAHDPHRHR